jgi:cytoskeletal protein CcmA (bactofilin family)
MAKNDTQITHLSENTTINGEIHVDNDIRVAGKINGKLSTSGHLIVENSGDLEAELLVHSATIAGTIKGNITSEDKLILESKAVLNGNIKTKQLIIEEGAVFEGNCSMGHTQSES